MKKLWITILVGLLVIPMMFQISTRAANVPIRVIIDGVPLSTDQAPVMVNGRTMVPLRAIFEAFNTTIRWDQKTQTVTAYKDDTTIILKIGSKIATINNKAVTLDVPGQNLKGRTMVPTRFVSEALGHEVGWNPTSKVVSITTSATNGGNVSPVSSVVAQDVSDYGDGRDLQVSFTRSANESLVDHYRVLIVKVGHAFNLSSAEKITSSNYSVALATGANPSIKLNAASRTVDGDLIKNNQAYVTYVLAVGKGSNINTLSNGSSAVTLVNYTVEELSNVIVSDISDYGDGRDLFVSFNKLSDESRINAYRIFVVKAADHSNFTLAKANAVSSSNYTQINKTGNNITQILSSGTRDVSGALVKTGVSYRVFIMAIASSNDSNNVLSSASAAITLSSIGVSNLTVNDVSDYNDGRDLKVFFNHAGDETYISQYRIMIVPTTYSNSFSLSEANALSSSYYTAVSTSGSTFNQILASSAKDVRGASLKNGTSYHVYVLSIGKGSHAGANVLSSASSPITLWSNTSISAVTNLSVSDISDYSDGRDLKVSFNHAGDETYISQYRIMVVPTSSYSSFSLTEANNVSNSNYTSVSTSGNSTSQVLDALVRDVRGALLKEGAEYKVYVLSLGNGNYSGPNALSPESSAITLTSKIPVISVANVTYKVDDGKILINFNKSSNEANISEYRVLVVPSKQGFGLTDALGVQASFYKSVTPNGTNPSVVASTKDVNGELITKGVKYKVFILAVANSSGIQNGGLSDSTDEFEIKNSRSEEREGREDREGRD